MDYIKPLLNYLWSSELTKFSNWLNRKQIPVATQKDISSRVATHWEQKNLIPLKGKRAKHTSRKISLVELVWILIIERLRVIGLPLEKIAHVKNSILDNHQILDSIKTSPESLVKRTMERINFSDSPTLEFAIFRSFMLRQVTYLIASPDGKAFISSQGELFYLIEKSKIADDLILINIHEIIKGIFPSKDLTPRQSRSLNEKDRDYLKILEKLYETDGNLIGVEVHFRNGKAKRMDVTTMEEIDESIEYLRRKAPFQELRIVTENDKTQNIKRIRKIML